MSFVTGILVIIGLILGPNFAKIIWEEIDLIYKNKQAIRKDDCKHKWDMWEDIEIKKEERNRVGVIENIQERACVLCGLKQRRGY